VNAAIRVEISNRQKLLAPRAARLRAAVRLVLADAGVHDAQISVALVDDATIAPLNVEFLAHEGPTDVLSFLLDRRDGYLEGEVIASAETALRQAPRFRNDPSAELLLYVIHGVLHLVGYDDATPADRRVMRRREQQYLTKMGIGS
jgi:probable rRNA maturation factor